MKPVRLLIDGPNLAHRSRHAHSSLRDPDGLATGVLFGVLSSLDKLLYEFDPDEVIFCWEGDTLKNWRKVLWPFYKSDRAKRIENSTEDEREDWNEFIYVQMPDLQEALTNMGIPQIAIPGLEADDVIGAITQYRINGSSDDSNYVIISTDKDMLQLAKRHRCRIYNPQTDVVYFEDKNGRLVCNGTGKKEVYAPSPNTWLLWRAIIGDTSDSIPGIEGVGEGTVRKLYLEKKWNREVGTQEYLRSVTLTGKRGKAIEEGMERVDRNLEIMDLNGLTAYRLLGSVGRKKYYMANHFFDCFFTGCVRSTVLPGPAWPRFLEHKEKYPNPMVRFFGIRNFDIAFEDKAWKEWVERYRVLYRRRREMYSNGEYIIPCMRA